MYLSYDDYKMLDKKANEATITEFDRHQDIIDQIVDMQPETSNEIIRMAQKLGAPDKAIDDILQAVLDRVNIDEGKMKDLAMHIEDMINDGASDEEIMKMHPEVSKSDIASIRKDMQESIQELPEADEVAESIAKMKAMAGVGSKQRSNHGIHEGEEGYQITPRSIVARQLRKLQDLAK